MQQCTLSKLCIGLRIVSAVSSLSRPRPVKLAQTFSGDARWDFLLGFPEAYSEYFFVGCSVGGHFFFVGFSGPLGLGTPGILRILNRFLFAFWGTEICL